MKSTLRESCDLAFGRLFRRFGLQLVGEVESEAGSLLLYQNATTAVKVVVETRNADVLVSLFRLRNGYVPLVYTIADRIRDPLNGFDVNDLISLRAPVASTDNHVRGTPSAETVESKLRTYATLLEAHASDVLEGEFSVFRDLAKLVVERGKDLRDQGYYTGPEYDSLVAALDEEESQAP